MQSRRRQRGVRHTDNDTTRRARTCRHTQHAPATRRCPTQLEPTTGGQCDRNKLQCAAIWQGTRTRTHWWHTRKKTGKKKTKGESAQQHTQLVLEKAPTTPARGLVHAQRGIRKEHAAALQPLKEQQPDTIKTSSKKMSGTHTTKGDKQVSSHKTQTPTPTRHTSTDPKRHTTNTHSNCGKNHDHGMWQSTPPRAHSAHSHLHGKAASGEQAGIRYTEEKGARTHMDAVEGKRYTTTNGWTCVLNDNPVTGPGPAMICNTAVTGTPCQHVINTARHINRDKGRRRGRSNGRRSQIQRTSRHADT